MNIIQRNSVIFASEISPQSATYIGKEEWESKFRKEKLNNKTKMKLFFVDQFNKVQEFQGTEEEKMQLAYAHNLYLHEYDAHEATQGRKVRYNPSIFTSGMLEKWTINRSFRPVQIQFMNHLEDLCRDSFRAMKRRGLVFDTEEEAKAVSDKLIAVLREEAARRASTPKQSQAPQDGQHQPYSEERQSQAQSSCGRTTHNSRCKCHEQGHPCSQDRVQVTVIEMFL